MGSISSDFVVVANRLPVDRSVDPDTGETRWIPSPGGLVSALKPVLSTNDGAWVGWPGTTDPVAESDMDSDSEITMVPVNLDATDFSEFYEGFSNATLWPLYHDLVVHPTYRRDWWQRYREVNQRFADAAAEVAAEGAIVWVQDYQLHLVAGMLREARPDVAIGFFLHIPFPSPELFRQLPWRKAILDGTLGADVVGFHTQDSARNFLDIIRALGHDVELLDDLESAAFLRGARLPDDGHIVGHVHMDDGRTVKVGVFPISIDTAQVNATATSADNVAAAAELRQQLGSPQILLAGVDRMDYTKGIFHRLEALEYLLDTKQLNAQDVVMVQVATPSRERLEDYQSTREAVERLVSRINGNHGRLGRPVVHYIHSGLPFQQIVGLYTATDVMLVTAIKDGMNLVAKEYVACHSNGSGALVLSEFTGAATQLVQAYLCNPHDVESMGAAILAATSEDPDAVKLRRKRMKKMWKHVRDHDVQRWADTFVEQLRDSQQ